MIEDSWPVLLLLFIITAMVAIAIVGAQPHYHPWTVAIWAIFGEVDTSELYLRDPFSGQRPNGDWLSVLVFVCTHHPPRAHPSPRHDCSPYHCATASQSSMCRLIAF